MTFKYFFAKFTRVWQPQTSLVSMEGSENAQTRNVCYEGPISVFENRAARKCDMSCDVLPDGARTEAAMQQYCRHLELSYAEDALQVRRYRYLTDEGPCLAGAYRREAVQSTTLGVVKEA